MRRQTCEHCGRTDVGSRAAGRAEVDVPDLDSLNRLVGTRKAVVCCPTVANRPQCSKLVAMFDHKVSCIPCARSNPPGLEGRYLPREVGQVHGVDAPEPVDLSEYDHLLII